MNNDLFLHIAVKPSQIHWLPISGLQSAFRNSQGLIQRRDNLKKRKSLNVASVSVRNKQHLDKDKNRSQNESAEYQSQPRTFDIIYDYIVNLISPTTTIIPPCVLYPCNPPPIPSCVSYPCGPPVRPPVVPPPMPIPPRYPCCPQCGQFCYRPYPYYPLLAVGGTYNPYGYYSLVPGIGRTIQSNGNIQNVGSAVQNAGGYIYLQ